MKLKLTFAVPAIDMARVQKTPDGAIILNARPARSGDYEYLGFEVPSPPNREIRWDQQLIGRLVPAEFEKILPQFKGLAVTDEHEWVEIGERDEVAIGTILKDAEMDGDWALTEALIHAPKAILKINSQSAVELSIGFLSNIRWSTGLDGEPDFYIEEVELNHVALVEEGRAGPDGRLLNHKRKLENPNMKTINIGGQDFQVDDAVAGEFSRLTSAEADLKTQLNSSASELATVQTTLANTQGQLTQVTTDRDTAVGRASAVEAENVRLKNDKPDVAAEAVRLANAHTAFAADAALLGYEKDLVLGAYDETAVKTEVLNARGVKMPEGASADTVNGAWLYALANAKAEPTNPKPSPLDSITDVEDAASDTAVVAISHSYFGG